MKKICIIIGICCAGFGILFNVTEFYYFASVLIGAVILLNIKGVFRTISAILKWCRKEFRIVLALAAVSMLILGMSLDWPGGFHLFVFTIIFLILSRIKGVIKYYEELDRDGRAIFHIMPIIFIAWLTVPEKPELHLLMQTLGNTTYLNNCLTHAHHDFLCARLAYLPTFALGGIIFCLYFGSWGFAYIPYARGVKRVAAVGLSMVLTPVGIFIMTFPWMSTIDGSLKILVYIAGIFAAILGWILLGFWRE